MTAATKSIVVERDMKHKPEKIWKALTTSDLIAKWLMANDFQPLKGHRFNFRATPIHGWNGVTDCKVLEIDPPHRLVYSWNASGDQAENGLKTIVTWTVEPTPGGARVRMEQAGFRAEDEMGFKAMGGGWPHILGRLEAETALL
ncbi:MAG: polyketide cyclase [Alphaproteobacteria bacterium]|nr:polyketide cyclase [Alphaproteobacteria bacterium]